MLQKKSGLMASTRVAGTVEEKVLVKAAEDGDMDALTFLLQKGVCPNVHGVL